jgi:hypothetical protein
MSKQLECTMARRDDGDYDVFLENPQGGLDAFTVPRENYLRLLQHPSLYGKAKEGEISARKLAKLRRKAGVTP